MKFYSCEVMMLCFCACVAENEFGFFASTRVMN